MMDEHLP
jgi:hypothetical protein